VSHENNVILTVLTATTPRVAPEHRVKIEPIAKTFSRVTLRFGYMESPNVPHALGIARKLGLQFDIMSTTFFLSRRLLKQVSEIPRWQDRLFIALAGIAKDVSSYFQVPTGRVYEFGTQVTV
jgi:KUP system potassium uptake protein